MTFSKQITRQKKKNNLETFKYVKFSVFLNLKFRLFRFFLGFLKNLKNLGFLQPLLTALLNMRQQPYDNNNKIYTLLISKPWGMKYQWAKKNNN